MNNAEVKQTLDDCLTEIAQVKTLIDGLGTTSAVVPFLTKYCLIRACGTIEQAFKSIIADYCDKRSKLQVKNFMASRVRESSMNPSYDKICKLLKDFDETWKNSFKANFNSHRDKERIMTSLKSLVDARNDFAHGGSPTVSIGDVLIYFSDARHLVEILDVVIG